PALPQLQEVKAGGKTSGWVEPHLARAGTDGPTGDDAAREVDEFERCVVIAAKRVAHDQRAGPPRVRARWRERDPDRGLLARHTHHGPTQRAVGIDVLRVDVPGGGGGVAAVLPGDDRPARSVRGDRGILLVRRG